MKISPLRRWTLVCALSACRLSAQAIAPSSELELVTSDPRMQQAFDWAKSQALSYAHGSNEPIGPWYEAALPGRMAFCMRDVSHQTTGAAALGLSDANRNMLERFAVAVSAQRDWAGYWEIDDHGRPSSSDYVNDEDFWYNLPANFDLLDAATRIWQWTEDESYRTGPPFQRFFESTALSYVSAWQLDPERILSRPRIMNQRRQQGRFVKARGIPSYTEGTSDFNVGTDLIAAEYRAFEDLRFIAAVHGNDKLSTRYATVADKLQQLIEAKAWLGGAHHFAGTLEEDGGRKTGSGDVMILYYAAARDPQKIRQSLATISAPAFQRSLGIEEESYIPQALYQYGEAAAAYETILDLSDPGKKRREYPEVSYAVIASFVTGMMGVESAYDVPSRAFQIHSLARLPNKTEVVSIRNLRVQQNVVDLEHDGIFRSSMTNRSGPPIRWRAEFPGRWLTLTAGGKNIKAKVTSGLDGRPVSWILTVVPPGVRVTVSRGK
jgi:hypothetical protein